MERIVIAGSAVDPPHLAHYQFAKALKTCEHADHCIWTPTGERSDKDLSAGRHRRRMAELAFGDLVDDRFTLDLSEVEGKMAYTIDRLERLSQFYPKAQILWSTGVDVLVPQEKYGGECEVTQWHRGRELLIKWPCLVTPRLGYPHPSTLGLPSHFTILDFVIVEMSSKDIRRRIRAGEPWKHLVDPCVAAYIEEHPEMFQ